MLVELTYNDYKTVNKFLKNNYIKINDESYMAVYDRKTHKCKSIIPFEDWYNIEDLDS